MSQPEAINTKITEMFNMKYPIIGAPMFLVSNQEMVVSATQAGGMGTFPALNFRPISKYKETILSIKEQVGDGAFGINIIVQKSNKYQHEQLDIAIEQEVPLLITSLGSPKDVIKRTRGTKTKVFCDVVGLKHAQKVADMGADGLIVVGSGAGGHGGDTSLFALLPYLKRHVDLPMVAAGCMSDGQSLLSALSLGADGIYMGTRIIASKEAQVSDDYKQAIIDAGCDDIVNTDRVDGFPGNFIKTPHLEKVLKPNIVDNILSQNKRVKRAVSLVRAGRALFGSQDQKLSYKNTFSAGHGVGLIDEVETI
ncbi:MAG: nitronate monooxygenase, partial [Bdellovibrionales bacterium]|nr:nitronate monooxygenase [Bdellovibrionales bacterium]NQZ19017.1 nitronate monooxygenase [Bdellovibrionales bacterium]